MKSLGVTSVLLLTLLLAFSSTGEAQVLQPSELCSDQPDAAIATFEDANLEARVRASLSVGEQDDLTCRLVSGWMGFLDAEQAGIESLVGIQNLRSLTYLGLGSNSITDISGLSGLTSLRGLYLYGNFISDLSVVSALTSLRGLFLIDNSISDISAVSGLTSLEILFLANNSITDISALSGLTSLTQLDLQANSITDIQPLLNNAGLGAGDTVHLRSMSVSCADVAALEAKGVTVTSDCR